MNRTFRQDKPTPRHHSLDKVEPSTVEERIKLRSTASLSTSRTEFVHAKEHFERFERKSPQPICALLGSSKRIPGYPKLERMHLMHALELVMYRRIQILGRRAALRANLQ